MFDLDPFSHTRPHGVLAHRHQRVEQRDGCSAGKAEDVADPLLLQNVDHGLRAGANENTTFECSTPVKVEGKPLAAAQVNIIAGNSEAPLAFGDPRLGEEALAALRQIREILDRTEVRGRLREGGDA